MPKVSEAIESFLRARRTDCNADLIDRWSPVMETQVNVSAGQGEPVDGRRNTWTDGFQEWHHIRIPKNAYSKPEFHDFELRFPLDLHAEGIGSTGWDWHARRSRWVGFDFDSLVGHAAGVGVNDAELERVKITAQNLDYVQVRKSTGGKGLHLYVYFDEHGIPTANHTEHAALARAILGRMSSEAHFNFASQIDACGGNMWLWHRKMTKENEGLKLLKDSTNRLSMSDLPGNWKDHIEVVTRRRAKIRVGGIEDEHQDPFEVLASSRRVVPLDDKHKAVIDALAKSGFSCVWVPDHHLIQTHTKALQSLLDDEDKRRDLRLCGFFKTLSQGNDPGTPNCFAFPLDNGGWKVYRFSPGAAEAETWTQDHDGWTTCYFNRQPSLDVAAKAMGGKERKNNGGFVFDTARRALDVVEALGKRIDLHSSMMDRETLLQKNRDGRLVVEVQKRDGDEGMSDWDATAKKGFWVKVFNVQTEQKRNDLSFTEYDNIVRSMISPDRREAGWVLRSREGDWVRQSKDNARSALLALGHAKPEAEVILGYAVLDCWKLVNLPFQTEYPGDRQWNYRAAQFRYAPAELHDNDMPVHPHWDLILNHCGQDLNNELRKLDWSTRANIKTGADYLRTWIACMFRAPFERLPYLFLFGDQRSGKSILHEAISLLMTGGVMSADKALTNKSDFNGELAHAVLCYVEEKNIAKAGEAAYEKIKEYVTGQMISVHPKGKEIYLQPNTTHWVQCANRPDACPVFDGDTRITMIWVPPLSDAQHIPKTLLLQKLEEEAPHFMRTLLDLTLPPLEDRLRLRIVTTQQKMMATQFTRNWLEQFLFEECHYCPGSTIPFKEFYERFQEWLPQDQRPRWSKPQVSRSLPMKFPSGSMTANVTYVGNISWEPSIVSPHAIALISVGNKLRPQE